MRWIRRGLLLAVVLSLIGAAAQVAGRRPAASPAATKAPGSTVATAVATRTTLVARELVNATTGYAPAPPVIVRRTGVYTWLPAEGSVLHTGSIVARVDGTPVVLLPGSVPAWRGFSLGMADGDDVRQLEAGLRRLGYAAGVTVDRHFSWATSMAVRRWQRAQHLRVTGSVPDGWVVFAPGPVRVGQPSSDAGTAVGATAPYDVTSTTRDVHADLDAARQAGVAVGQAVMVDFLNGRHSPGRISAVGRVATVPQDPNAPRTPTVPLTVTLTDPLAGGGLDQQPVQLELTTLSKHNVLALPVTALVALAEGGYAVETVSPTGAHSLVAVTPGLYASGSVEITRGISAGTTVVVAK